MSNITNYNRLNLITKRISNKENYINFLDFSKKFYEMDYKNQLLIFLQYPGATKVNTFIEWKKEGRKIKKNPRKIFLYGYYRTKQSKSIEGQICINGIKTKNKNTIIEYFNDIPYRRTCNYDLIDTYMDNKVKSRLKNFEKNNNYSKQDFLNCLINLYSIKNIDSYSKLNLFQKISLIIHERCHYNVYEKVDFENNRLKKFIGDSVGFLVANYFGFDIKIYDFNELEEFKDLKLEDKIQVGTIIQRESENTINLVLERLKNKEQICA